ncbi:ribonuclease H [Candidatus Lokiarchaeum ossiferum]|uniref:ribonuclease H n=1 Tax=Candidatus Lokiarchaeum ossiferum TaxID=2951803 RepID=UPI00352FDA55
MNQTSSILQVYTDGACEGNQFDRNYGGWAAIILENNSILHQTSGSTKNTTNNRMELLAVIRALQIIVRNKLHESHIIHIFSDSAYIVNCFAQKWYIKWKKNNWSNSQGKPVLNPDLWKALLSLVERCNFQFIKVKGHSGNKYNEMVDQLAVSAIKELKILGK